MHNAGPPEKTPLGTRTYKHNAARTAEVETLRAELAKDRASILSEEKKKVYVVESPRWRFLPVRHVLPIIDPSVLIVKPPLSTDNRIYI